MDKEKFPFQGRDQEVDKEKFMEWWDSLPDWRKDMHTPIVNAARQCATCKHMIPFTLTCEAYPDGIPKEILHGEWDHTEPYPECREKDGLLYEPRRPELKCGAPYARNKEPDFPGYARPIPSRKKKP